MQTYRVKPGDTHSEYTAGLTLAECRVLYPSGLEAIWEKVT